MVRSEPLGEVMLIVDVASALISDPLFRFNCGVVMVTGPPPLTVTIAAFATVSVLPAVIARNAVVLEELFANVPVPARVRLPVLCTLIVVTGEEPV